MTPCIASESGISQVEEHSVRSRLISNGKDNFWYVVGHEETDGQEVRYTVTGPGRQQRTVVNGEIVIAWSVQKSVMVELQRLFHKYRRQGWWLFTARYASL